MARRRLKSTEGRRRRSQLKWVVGVVVVLVVAGLTYAWSASRVIRLGYQISALQAELKEGYDLNRKLRIELASLRRPERVEAIASKQLGLIRPPTQKVIICR